MAGGGDMGGMPQGGVVGQPGMGNPMGGQPGMSGGLGMGGMGFGGGMPQGLGQGMPQGDTFQPQGGMPTMNMQQIGQMLRGLQGGQPQQMPQAAPMYAESPSMQQPVPQQPMMTGSAERNWISQSPYAQQNAMQQQQPPASIGGRRMFMEMLGGDAQPQQTTREMRNQSRGIADIPIRGRQSARQTLRQMRNR